MGKRFLPTLFCVLWVCSLTAQMPTSGLVAHYPFNRDLQKDSTRIYDQSKYGNHGTVMGTAAYVPDRFGVPCSALWFDGSTYVTVPSSRSLKKPQSQLTIAVWFKLADGAHFFNQWITICCKGDQATEAPDCPQYRMQATAQTVSINTEFTEEVIPQLKYDVWYFYAYTYDGSTVRAYLNGNQFYELDYSNQLEPNDMPLEIGRDQPGNLEHYYGAMDDLRLYDRALTGTELGQLYTDQSGANAPDRCQLPKRPAPKPDPL
ncbi:MAG: LamG domain-containing protein, partial [Saprospiraceae bacterium]